MFLEISQNSQKTPVPECFLTKLHASCNFIKQEALTRVFSCKFCEIYKNTFSYRTPPVAASVNSCTVTNFWSSKNSLVKSFQKSIKVYWSDWHYRSSHRRCSIRKGALRNLAKFTGKHLFQSLFFNKLTGLRPAQKSNAGVFLWILRSF